MLCAQFIFRPGTYDDEFHELDGQIEAFAQSLDGYVGVDRWVSDDGLSRNSIYYFRDRDARVLATFTRLCAGHVAHPASTARQLLAVMGGLEEQWLRDPAAVDLVQEWDRAVALLLP